MLLSVSDLSVSLEGRSILSGVSFDVLAGKTVAVIGPNGAGKTMLFRALLGLAPYSGRVAWGPDVQIGYVPQSLPFDKTIPITVWEFCLLSADRFWLPRTEYKAAVVHSLERFGLGEETLDVRVGSLSGGQLQRFLIAWAMLDRPDVLLLDEPTSGVDAGFSQTVYELLRKAQEEIGFAMLLISHDLSIVYRYADTVLCLDGALICNGVPTEVLDPKELQKLYGSVDGAFFSHADHHAHG